MAAVWFVASGWVAAGRRVRWRNTIARHPDILTAQRRERARDRSENGIRWGSRDVGCVPRGARVFGTGKLGEDTFGRRLDPVGCAAVVIEDVYFCVVHEPYTSRDHPVPINTTVVHARSLLHPAVPQPVGGLMYRCLVEFPGRRAGSVVPLATLTFELDGGRLWPQIGDWESVVRSVVELGRRSGCDALFLGLPARKVTLLVNGPDTAVTFHDEFGGGRQDGQRERQDVIDEITGHVRNFVAGDGPFWPGEGLVKPPARPHVMPYQPVRSIAVSVPPATRAQSDAALARSQRRLGLRQPDFRSNVAKDDGLPPDPWLQLPEDHHEVVICDTCNTDYTDSTESGGLITESRSYAFCPRCVRENRVETAPTDLLCPPHLSFYEFIKRNR